MRILIATNNPAKVNRVRKLLANEAVECLTLADAGITPIDTEEGSDIVENARRKALAYRTLTDLPILGMDVALVIPDEPDIDPAKIKRNAIGDRNEADLTQAEIAESIIRCYQQIVNQHGGELPAYMDDALALSLPNGEIKDERCQRYAILTSKMHKMVNLHFPLWSMYISTTTGKYVADQTEEETTLEISPFTNALKRLLGI